MTELLQREVKNNTLEPELLQNGVDLPRDAVDSEGSVVSTSDLLDGDELENVSPIDFSVSTLEDEVDDYIDHERAKRTTPESVKDIKARLIMGYSGLRMANLEVESPMDPNRPTLEDIIRDSEPWQTEIFDAVERFGMNELTLGAYQALSQVQRTTFFLNFNRFYQMIGGHARFIEITEGIVENDNRLAVMYGGNRTQAELLAYHDTLLNLKDALDSTLIPERVKSDFGTYYNRLKPSQRAKALKPDYHRYQITFAGGSARAVS